MEYLSRSAEETKKLGEKLGKLLKGGEIIALEGDLGGGKTLFTKGIGKGLGAKEEIISPSFTIERQYIAKLKVKSEKLKVKSGIGKHKSEILLHHFDFYRLHDSVEAIKQEVSELYYNPQKIIIIEWAQNLSRVLPKERLEIIFQYIDEDMRKIKFKPKGKKYQEIVQSLKFKVQSHS